MIDRRLAARLAHDVGKYVSRTARNLPAGPVPPRLVAMLVKDLWDLPAGGGASAVLYRLAPEDAEPELAAARAALAAADALEDAVRRGDEAAVRQAARHALEAEGALRTLAGRAR